MKEVNRVCSLPRVKHFGNKNSCFCAIILWLCRLIARVFYVSLRKNRCSGRAATNFWILCRHVVGRPAISGRRAACATARATSKTFKRLARVHAQVFFFFTFFFTVFPLATSRVERMRIEAKARKSKQKNKLNPFRNTGNRPLLRSSERSRSVYFFFLCFLASYFTRGENANCSEGKEMRKKV